MQKPSTYAFECILSVVDYLQNTNDLGITFGNAHGITGIYEASTVEGVSPEMQPVTWNDSAFGDLSPHMGCFVRSNYGASSWISKQIKFFTPKSSCEAEVGALMIGVKETMFNRHITEEFGIRIFGPSTIYTDNKAAYDLMTKGGVTKNTVHFERWLHYVRELYLRGKIRVFLVSTDVMWADDKTKVMPKKKQAQCRAEQLNLARTTE